MKLKLSVILFLVGTQLFSQHKFSKTVESDASFIEVHAIGLDDIVIEESTTNVIEMEIIDTDEIGVIDTFTCEDLNCVLEIKTSPKIKHKLTNKINQFPLAAPTNVHAVLRVPKNKRIAVFGETIDVTLNSYNGVIQIKIDKGKVDVKEVGGIVEVDLHAGSVFAEVKDETLNLKTRKGRVILNGKAVKSPHKKKGQTRKELVVKSINANVILTK